MDWGRETEWDRWDDWPICKADDDLTDDNTEAEEKEAAADDSNGVDSDAGGTPVVVLASRLQTGQNVLHDVSQASTHIAWNLWQHGRILSFSPTL